MPDFPVLHHPLEFAQTHVCWVSDAIQPSHGPLLLLPSIFLSIRVFYNKLALHIKEPKYWSFSISQKYLFPNIFLIYGGFLLCCCLKHVHRLPDGYYNKRCETAYWEISEYAVQRAVFEVWLYRSRNRGLGQVNELHDTSIFQYLNYW